MDKVRTPCLVITLVTFYGITVGAVTPVRGGTPDIDVETLSNGLRIVTATTNQEDLLSVRLVVAQPACSPTSKKFGAYRVAAFLLVAGDSLNGGIDDMLDRHGGASGVDVDRHHATLSFDLPPEVMDSLFTYLRRPWERGGLDWTQFYETQEECQREWRRKGFNMWGCSCASFEGTEEMFERYMVGSRMTLVVVGSEDVVGRAVRLAETLTVIPKGEPVGRYETDYAESLSEPGEVPGWYEDWTCALVVKDDSSWDPWKTSFYYCALSSWLNDFLGMGIGVFYDVGLIEIVSSNEHIAFFSPSIDEENDDPTDVAEIIETAMQKFNDSCWRGWWEDFVQGARVRDRLYGIESGDAICVANVLAGYAGYPGGMDRLTSGEMAYRPSPEEARRGYAELLANSRFFIYEPEPVDWKTTTRERLSGMVLTLWRDIFGPDDRHRAIAFMCQCVLVLVVLRGANHWSTRKTGKRSGSKRDGKS